MIEPVRLAAFDWIQQQISIYGDDIPRKILESGFEFQSNKISLVGPQGIWKPKVLKLPISITTISNGPYNDSLDTNEGLLNYKYRGTDPNHSSNKGMRELMNQKIPLIYFLSVVKGFYLAAFPVFIIQENPKTFSFTITVEDASYIKGQDQLILTEESPEYSRRSYLTSSVKQRLHQRSFRERVLSAYKKQCALCRLKHPELLDAAHIIPDNEVLGDPIIQNGISLCKIHHAAFDKNILGITPDYIIKVREDILAETDGPMLKFGLQSMQNQKLNLPSKKNEWPDQERLYIRYQRFNNAS